MSWCSWGWCWRSINTDHDWSRWSDWPPGCLVSARCGSSASARLFIEVVGSPTWCCHHHVAICFRLWDRCKPAELVVVGLVDVWHGGECHIGCAGRHGNQVTVKCVACGKTSVELMFHPPAESPEFCVEPVGGMCTDAVGIGAGQWTLLVTGAFGSLVCATNGLSRHPNPFGVTILKYLKELGVPCSLAVCSMCPLRTRLLVDDVVAHLSCWNAMGYDLVMFLHGLEVYHHSAS